MTGKDIIEQAGGAVAVAQRIGISAAGVRVMSYRVLPAAWYFALCDMTGKPLPRHLFSFKGLDATGGTVPARAWVDQ